MNKKLIEVNRDQGFLLPPDMNDWLPKDHLARYIVSIVEQLDLSSICNKYSLKGRKGIDPSVLLSLLFYGYSYYYPEVLTHKCLKKVQYRFLIQIGPHYREYN